MGPLPSANGTSTSGTVRGRNFSSVPLEWDHSPSQWHRYEFTPYQDRKQDRDGTATNSLPAKIENKIAEHGYRQFRQRGEGPSKGSVPNFTKNVKSGTDPDRAAQGGANSTVCALLTDLDFLRWQGKVQKAQTIQDTCKKQEKVKNHRASL